MRARMTDRFLRNAHPNQRHGSERAFLLRREARGVYPDRSRVLIAALSRCPTSRSGSLSVRTRA